MLDEEGKTFTLEQQIKARDCWHGKQETELSPRQLPARGKGGQTVAQRRVLLRELGGSRKRGVVLLVCVKRLGANLLAGVERQMARRRGS